MRRNLILMTDSYKVSHWRQYPPGTTGIYSYLEARQGAAFPTTTFFGLQYLLREYLARPILQHHLDEAMDILDLHVGEGLANWKGWRHIIEDHDGRLPVRIQAVPEGMVLPISNALMTVENTCPECFWLTNYLETLLVECWYPITVCTQSHAIKQLIGGFMDRTAGHRDGLEWKLHDFGFRGVSSPESAGWGGLAHLVNFRGTDTMMALQMGCDHYDAPVAGGSIAASEHSTITAWGEAGEADAFQNMIEQYGDQALYACVSDSWDIQRAVRTWGTVLRDQVLAAKGTLVVRPDSGDPAQVVLEVVKGLMHHFGYRKNSRGYDVLNDKVRVIQGDGVDYESIGRVLSTLEANGISAENVAFGMGGALLQRLDRDTMRFAFKASSAVVAGKTRDVFKRPATDPSKNSKRGRFAVRDGEFGHVVTRPEAEWAAGPNYLVPVFEDGRILVHHTLEDIRLRAEGVIPALSAIGA